MSQVRFLLFPSVFLANHSLENIMFLIRFRILEFILKFNRCHLEAVKVLKFIFLKILTFQTAFFDLQFCENFEEY